MSVCVESGQSNLLRLDHIVMAGYECTSVPWYIIIWFVAAGIQILRNLVWVRSSQASRLALQVSKTNPRRAQLVNRVLLYTAVSFVLHILSFLIILGANLGFMVAVLVGNLLGTWYGMNRQSADSTPLSKLEEMTELMSDFNNKKPITDAQELEDLKMFREQLVTFLSNNEEYSTVLENRKKVENIKF